MPCKAQPSPGPGPSAGSGPSPMAAARIHQTPEAITFGGFSNHSTSSMLPHLSWSPGAPHSPQIPVPCHMPLIAAGKSL